MISNKIVSNKIQGIRMFKSTYLDYNSTCPIRKEVIDLRMQIMRAWQNPSAPYASGVKMRACLRECREIVRNALQASKCSKVIFTSSATEANNLISWNFSNKLMVSAVEHSSMLIPSVANNAILLTVNSEGLLDLDFLSEKCEEFSGKFKSNFLVSVIFANNETGVVQDLAAISHIVHSKGGVLHTDAVQALGKIDVSMQDMGIDALTVSGHKIGAGPGAAALVLSSRIENFHPMILGGGQEGGVSAGTEDIISIKAFCWCLDNIPVIVKQFEGLLTLRNYLELAIAKVSNGKAIFVGTNAKRLPNTSCIGMPNVNNSKQMMYFDLNNIEVGTGSACSSGRMERSNVMEAMNIPSDISSTLIRVSLGPENVREEINRFVDLWADLYLKQF